MFTYTLAADVNFGHRLRGIAPSAGLPHYGFNFGPIQRAPMSLIGIYGTSDEAVPPIANYELNGAFPDRTVGLDPEYRWFYQSAESVHTQWATMNGCNAIPTVDMSAAGLSESDYINMFPKISFWKSDNEVL